MVSASVPRPSGWWPPAIVRGQVAGAIIRLVAIGFLSIGVSGLVAGGMGLAFGKRFIAGTPAAIAYPAERCAVYLEYEPGAGSCERAATLHHYEEVVGYRLGAGVLGSVLFGAVLLARRRWTWLAHRNALPDGFEATIATTAFGLATAGLLGEAAAQLSFGETAGAGAFLSAGVVAFAVAAAFGASLFRALSRRWMPPPPVGMPNPPGPDAS